MERRRFILASGSTVLAGTGISGINKPAIGLEFELSTTPKKDPSSVDSVLVDFSQFELTPQYINSSDNLTVQITVSLDNIDSKQVQSEIQVKQDISRADISSELPLSIDGIDTSQDSIDGAVEIIVSHPDLNDQTYRQSFEISNSRIGIIDDFEDNNLSEYVVQGEPSTLQTQSNVTFEGTYALQMSGDGATTNNGIIVSSSGLERYPRAGDTFKFRHRGESDPQRNAAFIFGVQDPDNIFDNTYGLWIDYSNSQYELRRYDSTGNKTIASSNANPNNYENEWNLFTVDWGEGGLIEITIEDSTESLITSFSTTDSTYTSGGIGFYTVYDSATDYYWDIAEITDTTNSTGIIDDFEDGDLSEYSGGDGTLSVKSNAGFNGSYGLTQNSNVGSEQASDIVSMSGLPRYPQAGDTFEYWWKWNKGDDPRGQLGFGVQSESTDAKRYFARMDSNGRVNILKYDGSSYIEIANSEEPSFTSGNWYRCVVDWETNGNMTITAYDSSGNQIGQASGSDSSYKSGGISWEIGDNTDESYIDYARIISSS